MVSKTAVVSLIGLLGMVYQATQLPPPPKSDPPGGFVVDIDVDDNGDGLVDAARIRLSDGRLAGVALIVPTINYEWPSLPQSLIRTDYRRRLIQWSLWIAKHIPGLLYWWITQKDVPSTSVLERNPVYFSDRDIEVLKTTKGFPMLTQDKLQDRSVFYALRGDVVAAFGDWGFDPVRLSNPFPHNESSVHIWQGYEDKVVPFQLQRFISRKLSWIKYHEVRDGGHLILHYNDVDNVSRLGLKGENCVLH
ncbi:Hydrolase 4 domain-containing protein [Citrus sinensis]|uniref:Hydrolase 4 domain-containing protein n=1 Tax=Citrus sinensis TaxID=2711 RepID=A0ACB8IRT1_CITSI|nr:Hydrolase 4 domain-containing protein [Citrus sinensis]